MAGKYQITAEFSLETRIEPEGVRFDRYGSEVEDNSSFSDADVECYGGDIGFEVEADSEEEAEGKSEETIYEGMEIEDDNGFTWVVASLSVKVEEIVPPMDAERAKVLISAYLDYEVQSGRIDAETRRAFDFVLDMLTP